MGGKLFFILRKWKFNQLKRDNVINYNFNNFAKESSRDNKGSKGGNSLRP